MRWLLGSARWLQGNLFRHGPIALIVTSFLALGSLYSTTVPLFETPGEPGYIAQIENVLTRRRGLTQPRASAIHWEGANSSSASTLYVALGGLVVRALNPDWRELDQPITFQPNPYAKLWTVAAADNVNVALHLTGEGPPYRGTAFSVLVLRLLSVVFSSFTVWLAYLVAGDVVPGRRPVAVLAAAMVAFNPQFAFVSAAASPMPMAIMLVSLASFVALKIVASRKHRGLLALALGIATGLAISTHPLGIATALLIPAAHLAAWRRGRPFWEGVGRPFLISLAASLVLVAWGWAGSILGPQIDPSIMSRAEAVAYSAAAEDAAGTIQSGEYLFASYWGLFGWRNIKADVSFYAVARVLTLLGAIGLVLCFLDRVWRRTAFSEDRVRMLALLGVQIVSVLAVSVVVHASNAPRDASRAFLAITAVSCVFSLGMSQWAARRGSMLLTAVSACLMAGMSLATPFRFIAPAYSLPARTSLGQLPVDMQDADAAFGDSLYLVGYQLPQQSVRVGDVLRLRLYWLARTRMSEDHVVSLRVLGRGGEQVGVVETFPGRGNYPTRMWVPNDVVVDEHAIQIGDGGVPVIGQITVGVRSQTAGEFLPVSAVNGRVLANSVAVGRLRITPRNTRHYAPARQLRADLGDRIALIGFDHSAEPIQVGQDMVVDLYWQCLRRLAKDYTVFVHLVDGSGKIVAQTDDEPLGGEYPTHEWRVDEQLRDSHTLQIPDSLSAGEYQVLVGLYLPATGERLSIVSVDGEEPRPGSTQSHVALDSVLVVE